MGRYLFPKSRFFGIGNGDEQEPEEVVVPVDPLAEETAVATRFRHDDVLAELAARAKPTDELTLSLMGAYRLRQFDPDSRLGTSADILDIYDRAQLVGYDSDLANIYGELQLGYDTRHTDRFYLSKGHPSAGWNLGGFLGYQRGLDDDPSDFWRWGADLQRYINLYGGDRTLVLRTHVEHVIGDLDQIPFVDLPPPRRTDAPAWLRARSVSRSTGRIRHRRIHLPGLT